MENTIFLKGVKLDESSKEAVAAILPGMLIEETSAGKLQAHSTEGGAAERFVACEDALQGKTTADAYAAGEYVTAVLALPGAECNMVLEAGQNVAKMDNLVSAGNGKLIAAAAVSSGVTGAVVVAKACEAKNLTASGAVDTLIRVRFM